MTLPLGNLPRKVSEAPPRQGRRTAAGSLTPADTGPGIPPDQLEAVFEKYKRLKAGEGEAGFGLGLAISRKIVELHGGKIWAEGSPGGVFKFTVK